MSKHKDSLPEDKNLESDELFDHDPLNDSDSEFLAELDRVLGPDSDFTPLEEEVSTPGGPEETNAGSEGPDALSDEDAAEFESLLDDMPDEPSDSGLDERDKAEVGTGDTEPELSLESATLDDLPPPISVPEEAPALLDEDLLTDDVVDLSPASEPLAEMDRPDAVEEQAAELQPDSQAEASAPSPEDETEAPVADGAESPARDDTSFEAILESVDSEDATGIQQEKSGETGRPAESADADESTLILPPPIGADARPAEAASAQPVAPRDSGGGAWNGLVALLAVLGLGVGGFAMWQGSTVDERIATLGNRVANVQPAAPAPAALVDNGEIIELRERLGDLSRENRQLRSELAALRTDLQQRMASQEQQWSSTLKGLQASLGGLESELQSISLSEGTPTPPPVMEPAPVVEPSPAPPEPPVQEKTAEAEAAPPAPETEAEPASEPESKPKKASGWVVNLLSFPSQDKAETAQRRLQGISVPAEIAPADVQGKTWYRVQVSGFADQGEALAFAKSVRKKPGLSSAWVGKQ